MRALGIGLLLACGLMTCDEGKHFYGDKTPVETTYQPVKATTVYFINSGDVVTRYAVRPDGSVIWSAVYIKMNHGDSIYFDEGLNRIQIAGVRS